MRAPPSIVKPLEVRRDRIQACGPFWVRRESLQTSGPGMGFGHAPVWGMSKGAGSLDLWALHLGVSRKKEVPVRSSIGPHLWTLPPAAHFQVEGADRVDGVRLPVRCWQEPFCPVGLPDLDLRKGLTYWWPGTRALEEAQARQATSPAFGGLANSCQAALGPRGFP